MLRRLVARKLPNWSPGQGCGYSLLAEAYLNFSWAEAYFNKPEMNANNGIVADAYMNFGFAGLILWAILLAVILKLVDTFSKGKNIKVAIASIAMPVIAFTNSALLTTVLTHGVFLALILLYLLPKKKITKL